MATNSNTKPKKANRARQPIGVPCDPRGPAALCPGPARLADYDVIAVSTSGGKDSMATLQVVVELAEAEGVKDRVVAIHSDLGDRVEWPGAGAVAREQAAFWGVPFVVTSRIGKAAAKDSSVYGAGETFGDLIDYAERRGSWPSDKARWCTSEFKRGPITTVYTALARDWRARTGEGRACRILDCQGIRAQEGPARSKKAPFKARKATSTQVIDTWYPIFHWLEDEDLWPCILDSGAPIHYAYRLGSRRLSCVFCIYSQVEDLVVAGRANPDLLDAWAAAEERMGHTLHREVTLREVQARIVAEAPQAVEPAAVEQAAVEQAAVEQAAVEAPASARFALGPDPCKATKVNGESATDRGQAINWGRDGVARVAGYRRCGTWDLVDGVFVATVYGRQYEARSMQALRAAVAAGRGQA